MKIKCVLAGLAILLGAAAAAQAAPIVLTFEDLRPAAYAGLSPTYAGLTWAGDYTGSGGSSGWAKAGYGPDCDGSPCPQDYLPESPYMGVFTKNGSIRFSAPTTFLGAWFSSQSNIALSFSFYSDAAMQHLLPSLSFTEVIEHQHPIVNEFVAGPGTPIQAIRIQSSSTVWIMDDFTYCSPTAGCGEVPAVPEPATLSLLGLGLAGLARAVRRRKN